jgi:hypothetical protein
VIQPRASAKNSLQVMWKVSQVWRMQQAGMKLERDHPGRSRALARNPDYRFSARDTTIS